MSRTPKSVRRLYRLLAVVALGGCTFDYSGAGVERDADSSVPQVEILGVRMVVERTNRIELTADRVASFPDEGFQEFDAVTFREYGPDGALRLEGIAERAILYLDTEDIELKGEVEFYSTVEETRLESEFLYWADEDRELRGAPDEPVLLERDDGSRVRGTGMTVDGRRNSVGFSGGVDGTFQSEAADAAPADSAAPARDASPIGGADEEAP